MIKKEEVHHVAQLARLGLTEKEIEKMQKDLSSILDYIEKLKEVDISNVDFFLSSANLRNVMREDEAKEKTKVKKEKLLELAPDIKEGYLKTKQIL